jgi:hypothetical protein
METRCGSSNRSVTFCKNRLITISIQKLIFSFDVRRKRDVANLPEDVRDFGLTGEGNLPSPAVAHLQCPINPLVKSDQASTFYFASPFDENLPVPLSSVPRGEQEQFTPTPGLFFSDQPRRKDAGVIQHEEISWMEII